jgi:hypothetical protein
VDTPEIDETPEIAETLEIVETAKTMVSMVLADAEIVEIYDLQNLCKLLKL